MLQCKNTSLKANKLFAYVPNNVVLHYSYIYKSTIFLRIYEPEIYHFKTVSYSLIGNIDKRLGCRDILLITMRNFPFANVFIYVLAKWMCLQQNISIHNKSTGLESSLMSTHMTTLSVYWQSHVAASRRSDEMRKDKNIHYWQVIQRMIKMLSGCLFTSITCRGSLAKCELLISSVNVRNISYS